MEDRGSGVRDRLPQLAQYCEGKDIDKGAATPAIFLKNVLSETIFRCVADWDQ